MEQICLRSSAATAFPPACVTALGFFDGVHLGHRALLSHAVADAERLGCAPAVLTFCDADTAFKPGTPRLTADAERLSLLEACGVEYAFLADFSALRDYSPARFVREVLVAQCRTRTALCGFNFRFGAGAAGDAEALRTLMRECGGDALILPPMTLPNGQVISSSAIRHAVEAGDMEAAAAMLGREYDICQPVVKGLALGRKLGIPTVNQNFPPLSVIPARGVYAVMCEVDGASLPGVANVGVRPTVSGSALNCETHIIGFRGWLYGQSVRLRFRRKLRDEIRFDSLEALKAQIEHDICEVKEIYGK